MDSDQLRKNASHSRSFGTKVTAAKRWYSFSQEFSVTRSARTILLHFALVLTFLPLTQPAAATPGGARFFDFGPASQNAEGAIAIDASCDYNSAIGYGLVESRCEAYSHSKLDFADRFSRDGLKSDASLDFRIDLPNGLYWVELILDGGRFTTWRGEIAVNGSVAATKLRQYTTAEEGESPPSLWQFLTKAEVTDNHLLVTVNAENQPVAVAGIKVFPQEEWPIQYQNGELQINQSFVAPNTNLIINLINRNAVDEAQRLIDALPPKYNSQKAWLLLGLAGNIYTKSSRPLIELAHSLLNESGQIEKYPLTDFLLSRYLEADTYYQMAGWDWATVESGAGIFDRMVYAGQLYDELVQVSGFPLCYRSWWNLGRLTFMDWVEEHGDYQIERARECFAFLKKYYPDHELLAIYNGEKIVTEEMLPPLKDHNTPAWVAETDRAMDMLRSLIHYWVNNRQAENGEFGGKYDDDVEMLRTWPIVRLAMKDSIALVGLQRIVDGIWNSGWIEKGFSAAVKDVEHAAEPVADTQPFMIGLDYGNPIYVERCMETVKGLFNVWTGINDYGHRHFKSSWYSATEIDTRPPKDCDLQMNARTVKVARWLAWYNRHPKAMQFLTEWGDAWLEDCLRSDKGKPKGIVPAAVRYSDDAIGGHADNWHHPGMFWSYFDFRGGTQMMQQLLATYQLTGERKYLQPIELALDLVQKYRDSDTESAEIGSEAWVAGILKRSKNFAEVIEQWRLMTGDDRFDDLVKAFGSHYIKFYLTGNTDYLYDGAREISEGIAYNWELVTTEGYYTDRIYIGNLHQEKSIGSSHLESMYTGAALSGGFHPFYAISWDGFNDDFVAAVRKATPTELELTAYNLSDEPQTGRMLSWTLQPGEYELLQSPPEVKKRVSVTDRNASIDITLPPGRLQQIRLDQISAKHSEENGKADVAITDKELSVDCSSGTCRITIPVHNIGIKKAEQVVVRLVRLSNGESETVAEKTIPLLEAPLDLEPKIETINFELDKNESRGHFAIVIDPENTIHEITRRNNKIDIWR